MQRALGSCSALAAGYPQATELTEKSKRLAVLEGLLNMNDKDIVTDTEPEQQYQTDNRQRGQEER